MNWMMVGTFAVFNIAALVWAYSCGFKAGVNAHYQITGQLCNPRKLK